MAGATPNYNTMKAYTIAMPPHGPGIYSLINSVTGNIYIGRSTDLHRRYSEWRSALTTNVGHTNKQVMKIALAGKSEDWSFVIMAELPNATDSELAALERRAIIHVANKRPNDILNVGDVPKSPKVRGGGGSAAMTTILADDLSAITYRHAADKLGLSLKSLAKRLAKKRGKGVTTVMLSDLIAQSEKAAREGKKSKCNLREI